VSRLLKFLTAISITICLSLAQWCLAQDAAGNKSWTTTSEQRDPAGTVNPIRTTQTHSESNGRIIDKTTVETLGPDGRYIPYSESERESVRVDANTVRNIERSYGTDPDGHRTLTQQSQEETRNLPDGEQKMVRTISDPDTNGSLQVIRRELVDSKQSGPGVRDTSTTVFSADGSGGFAAAVQIQEREKQNPGGTLEFTKSTSLSDGSGHWNLSEVRQGSIKRDGQSGIKEETVLRPDSNGKMSVAERTVSRQAASDGETRDTTETYSTNVPGQAGNDTLQLVQRESTVHRTTDGRQSTTRQVETPSAGNPGDGLHLTQQAIDIVRPDGRGSAEQKATTVTFGPEGQVNTMWVDVGKTSNPAVVTVDSANGSKQKQK
jgi:hypothetical protein